MIGLDFLSSCIYSAATLFLSFWLGYILLGRRSEWGDLPFPTLLPLYLSLGLVMLTLCAVVLGMVTVLPSVVVSISLIAMAGVVYRWLRPRSEPTAKNHSRILASQHLLPVFVALAILVVMYLYFNIVAGIMLWPPPGDLIGHGYLTSLFIYRGLATTNFLPIVNYPEYYPSGAHILVANLAELLGFNPGEAWLGFGAIIMVLIATLVFSLTYSHTCSVVLSIIPSLAVFYVNQSGDLTSYVLGYLYNGPYPNLFAYLIAIVLIYLATYYRREEFHWFMALAVTEGVLLSVYPNFLPSVGAICAIPLATSLRGNTWKKWGRARAFLFLALLILLVIALVRDLTPVIQNYAGAILGAGLGSGYEGTAGLEQDLPTLLTVVLGSTLAVWNILRKSKLIFLGSVEIVCISFISLSTLLPSSVLSVFEPERLIPLVWVLSVVLVCVSFSEVLRSSLRFGVRLHGSKRHFRLGERPKAMATVLFLVLMVFVFESSLASAATFAEANTYSYYSHGAAYPSDSLASEWLCQHVTPGPLILNDQSWSGYFLTSYCFERVVYYYFYFHPAQYDDANLVWLHPENETLVRTILNQLDIKYVYVTSDPTFLNYYLYANAVGHSSGPTLLDVPQVIHYFDNYSFLRMVYQVNDSTVYTVNMTQ